MDWQGRSMSKYYLLIVPAALQHDAHDVSQGAHAARHALHARPACVFMHALRHTVNSNAEELAELSHGCSTAVVGDLWCSLSTASWPCRATAVCTHLCAHPLLAAIYSSFYDAITTLRLCHDRCSERRAGLSQGSLALLHRQRKGSIQLCLCGLKSVSCSLGFQAGNVQANCAVPLLCICTFLHLLWRARSAGVESFGILRAETQTTSAC